MTLSPNKDGETRVVLLVCPPMDLREPRGLDIHGSFSGGRQVHKPPVIDRLEPLPNTFGGSETSID